jgi:hypothetical protein
MIIPFIDRRKTPLLTRGGVATKPAVVAHNADAFAVSGAEAGLVDLQVGDTAKAHL